MDSETLKTLWHQNSNHELSISEQEERKFLQKMRLFFAYFFQHYINSPINYNDFFACLNEEEKMQFRKKLRKYPLEGGVWFGIRDQLIKDNESSWRFWYPEILEMVTLKNGYAFDTMLGKIHVLKASETLKTTPFAYLLQNKFFNQCFSCSYDYLKNAPYDHVLLTKELLPIAGYYYHAFIETKDAIIDLAQNAIYLDKQKALHILGHQVLFKLSFLEVQEYEQHILKDIPNIYYYFSPLSAIIAYEEFYLKRRR